MSSHLRRAGDTRDRLEQKHRQLKKQRDDLCRYLAGWCCLSIAPGSDPIEVLETCKEAAEVCHNTEMMEIADRISNYTLDMRKLQELLRSMDSQGSHFVI